MLTSSMSNSMKVCRSRRLSQISCPRNWDKREMPPKNSSVTLSIKLNLKKSLLRVNYSINLTKHLLNWINERMRMKHSRNRFKESKTKQGVCKPNLMIATWNSRMQSKVSRIFKINMMKYQMSEMATSKLLKKTRNSSNFSRQILRKILI